MVPESWILAAVFVVSACYAVWYVVSRLSAE